MYFRKFGTFRTPHGWLTTTGDGEVLQRGSKRGESETPVASSSNLQFEVTIENTNRIKIKRGTVIAGIGKMEGASQDPPTICNKQFYIRNIFASTLTSTMGSSTGFGEPYVNDNGYVTLPSNPVEGGQSGHVGIWIARNVHKVGTYARLSEGYPFLIVDQQAGLLDLATRPWGIDGCDAVEWYIIDDLMTNFVAEQQFHFKLANSRQQSQKNYNCQRFRIADVKYESGSWKVYQYWQGTVTIPHPYCFKGIYESIDQYPYDSLPTWRYDPEKLAEQEDWEQEMSTNDKTHAYPTIYETIP